MRGVTARRQTMQFGREAEEAVTAPGPLGGKASALATPADLPNNGLFKSQNVLVSQLC